MIFETLFFCKQFLYFDNICMAAVDLSETVLFMLGRLWRLVRRFTRDKE